jgi:hypothetical protein
MADSSSRAAASGGRQQQGGAAAASSSTLGYYFAKLRQRDAATWEKVSRGVGDTFRGGCCEPLDAQPRPCAHHAPTPTANPTPSQSQQDELLNVIYWWRQIAGVLLGLALGAAPVTGIMGVVM